MKSFNILTIDELKSYDDNVPTIIEDKTDCATVWRRKYLKNPNVLSVFKKATIDLQNNNKPLVDARYHFNLIKECQSANSADYKQKDELTDEMFNKIKVVNAMLNNPHFENFKDKVDFDSRRHWDVNFCGTINYPNELLRSHRQLCYDTLKGINNIGLELGNGRIHHKLVYKRMLKNTKIVVSPWGWGEMCYRDWEAMLCGCVLIKPDTDFVRTAPDIFNKDHYVKCEVNFSDLEEKIHHVIDNWDDFYKMRVINQSITSGYIEQYDKIYQNKINEVINGND